jgi:predicted nucleotidyltransferase
MSKQANIKKLNLITKKIVKEYDPDKIILFGSYAWGEPGPDSDVDLFIVKETGDSLIERHKKIGWLLFGSGIPIDVLIYTPSQVKRLLDTQDFFIEDVFSKGKILYEKKYAR